MVGIMFNWSKMQYSPLYISHPVVQMSNHANYGYFSTNTTICGCPSYFSSILPYYRDSVAYTNVVYYLYNIIIYRQYNNNICNRRVFLRKSVFSYYHAVVVNAIRTFFVKNI